MAKKFSKVASADIIRLLKDELKTHRQDIQSVFIRDIESKIKTVKEKITSLGVLIKKVEEHPEIVEMLIEQRTSEEKTLEYLRGEFKGASEDVHYAKEMIRHLEHAIAVLKKEFNQ